MYAEFSYDLAGADEGVLLQMLLRFDFKPNGQERRRCQLLTDCFICEIQNAGDYLDLHRRLSELRTSLGNAFDYTLSLRGRGDPIRIRAAHNEALASQIING